MYLPQLRASPPPPPLSAWHTVNRACQECERTNRTNGFTHSNKGRWALHNAAIPSGHTTQYPTTVQGCLYMVCCACTKQLKSAYTLLAVSGSHPKLFLVTLCPNTNYVHARTNTGRCVYEVRVQHLNETPSKPSEASDCMEAYRLFTRVAPSLVRV